MLIAKPTFYFLCMHCRHYKLKHFPFWTRKMQKNKKKSCLKFIKDQVLRFFYSNSVFIFFFLLLHRCSVIWKSRCCSTSTAMHQVCRNDELSILQNIIAMIKYCNLAFSVVDRGDFDTGTNVEKDLQCNGSKYTSLSHD